MRPIHPSFQGAKLWLPSPTPHSTQEVNVRTVDELRQLLQLPELSEQDIAIRRFRESQRLVLDTGLVDRQGNRVYEMDWLHLEAETDFAGPVFVRYWGPDRGFLLHRHDQTDTQPWDATLARHATRVQNYWNETTAFFQQFRWHPL